MTAKEYFKNWHPDMERDAAIFTRRDGREYLMCPNCYKLSLVEIHEEFKFDRLDNNDKTGVESYFFIEPRRISKYCNKCYGIHTHIELDTGIARAVSDLNKKGYYTYSSCEGHVFNDKVVPAFIMFQNRPGFLSTKVLDLFEDLSTSWFIDRSDHLLRNGVLLIKSDNLSDQQVYLRELEEWVETLPKCPC